MKLAAIALSWIALAIMLIMPVATFMGAITLDTCKHGLLAGTILWFATGPIAVKKKAG